MRFRSASAKVREELAARAVREGDHGPEDRAQMLEKQDRLTELFQRFVIVLNEFFVAMGFELGLG